MKVYIVTDGDYSDYHIEAVFTNKVQAELFCAVRNFCNIEEYEADDHSILTNKTPKKCVMAKVEMENEIWRDVEEKYTLEYCEEFIERDGYMLISITVGCDTSLDEAEKIMRDKYAEWKYKRMMGEV